MSTFVMPSKVAVLVAGSWGTALANVLAGNAREVVLYSRDAELVAMINCEHQNKRYLPDVLLDERIRATCSIEDAVQGAYAVLLAVPSTAMREIVRKMKPFLDKSCFIVHATKGFEPETLKRMSTVIAEETGADDESHIVVLSGPSHAEEVVKSFPTTVVVASTNLQTARKAQDLFSRPHFRVYTNEDVIGLEVAGALKNIVAIGAGMSDGLGFGDNAKAALITRGLAEMTRLGVALGAQPATFAGLAGIGDLVVTCTSQHSRNWRAGYQLGQGKPLDQVLSEMGMVVEGVKSTMAAYQLAQREQVEMPITTELYRIMVEHKSPREAVVHLMGRDKTGERHLGA